MAWPLWKLCRIRGHGGQLPALCVEGLLVGHVPVHRQVCTANPSPGKPFCVMKRPLNFPFLMGTGSDFFPWGLYLETTKSNRVKGTHKSLPSDISRRREPADYLLDVELPSFWPVGAGQVGLRTLGWFLFLNNAYSGGCTKSMRTFFLMMAVLSNTLFFLSNFHS